jgi:nitrogen PTS system EIIA component
MRMSDFVVREAIVPSLTATTKEGVIREIVESLRAAGYFQGGEADDIVRAILKREQLGSTGIGRSIAIPHTKHSGVDRLVGTVALSQNGVPFDSIDGEAVHLFVLLVSPQDRPGDHLRALENVVRQMRDDNFVKSLRGAKSRDEIWRLLEEPGSSGDEPEGWSSGRPRRP